MLSSIMSWLTIASDRSTMAQEEEAGAVVLPEDILAHIHSLMPMRDAARAACVSRVFLRSWRCYPKLDFDMETLGLEEIYESPTPMEEVVPIVEDLMSRGVIASYRDYFVKNNPTMKGFVARVDHIMHNHSGTGVTKCRLRPPLGFYIDPAVLNRWSEAVMKPGIREFELELAMDDDGLGYSFPCSLLFSSDRGGSTITSFTIAGCGLHSLHSHRAAACLSRAHLHNMRVTAEQLCCFLASCPALEQLQLSYCHGVPCFKIPHLLSRLRLLQVRNCNGLQMIQCDAPKLESFRYLGSPMVQMLFFGADRSPSPLTEMKMMSSTEDPGMLCYGTTKLPSVAPNLRSLFLSSCFETADTPPALDKFRHLNYLEIQLHKPSRCPDYDFCSLVSFLNASPALETFILHLEMPEDATSGPIIPGESSQGGEGKSRHQLSGGSKLTTVLIRGFSSAKGLVELTGHILEKAALLKHLILDTSYGCNMGRRHCHIHTICPPLTVKALMEARKALDAIKRCILGRVPSSVKFRVVQPCSKCHTSSLDKQTFTLI
ncbi:unnamed protein product [Urochloa humidicola]